MSNCRRYQDLVEDYLADEIAGDDRTDLENHCATCPECAGLLAMHKNLLALGEDIPLPDRHDLREMREAVLAASSRSSRSGTGPEAPAPRSGFIIELGHLWRSHPLPSGLATAAVLVCAVLLGQWIPQDSSLEDQLLHQASQWPAARQASLDSYLDSPFTFANVSVRPRGQGQLALSFDASRHVDMQLAQDSPLAKEVLLHAIMEPSSMGSRLRAMEVTPQIGDGRLKEAMIATMLNDPDPTVRINALAVLARYPYNQQSEDALLQILTQDQDVQMRLLALEELARQNVGPDTIRKAVGENNPDGTMTILREASVKF